MKNGLNYLKIDEFLEKSNEIWKPSSKNNIFS